MELLVNIIWGVQRVFSKGISFMSWKPILETGSKDIPLRLEEVQFMIKGEEPGVKLINK